MTGRDVHREWREGMLAQGREVSPERMEWGTLDQRDRDLDDDGKCPEPRRGCTCGLDAALGEEPHGQ